MRSRNCLCQRQTPTLERRIGACLLLSGLAFLLERALLRYAHRIPLKSRPDCLCYLQGSTSPKRGEPATMSKRMSLAVHGIPLASSGSASTLERPASREGSLVSWNVCLHFTREARHAPFRFQIDSAREHVDKAYGALSASDVMKYRKSGDPPVSFVLSRLDYFQS